MRLASIRSSWSIASGYDVPRMIYAIMGPGFGPFLWSSFMTILSVLPTNNELELKIQYMVIIGAY